jgi:hypothetical protein
VSSCLRGEKKPHFYPKKAVPVLLKQKLLKILYFVVDYLLNNIYNHRFQLTLN